MLKSMKNRIVLCIYVLIALQLFTACRKEDENEKVLPIDVSAKNEVIINGGFEDWLGSGKEMEPQHWHAFMSADGEGIAYIAARTQQVQRSEDVRPGSSGQYSVCIYSRSVMGIIANGNLTTGRIHVGSSNASDASNYNFTQRSQAAFCHVLTSKPDSIRFWAKFVCPNKAQMARMNAIIHDACDYRDPEISSEAAFAVARACVEFTGDGEWHYYSVPFSYDSSTAVPQYILISFTTNREQGKGSKNDKLYIDDVDLVYAEK